MENNKLDYMLINTENCKWKQQKKSHKIKLNKLDESKNQYSYYF